MSIEKQIRVYILENFLFTDDESMLANDDSFLENGFIDSTGIMELITFLEEEFGLVVEADEMIPKYLDSVDRITAFISMKALNV